MSFGKRLKEARKEKKLTQQDVANALDIDDTTISKYENDKSEPDNETLNKLSKLYGVNTHWIHTGQGHKNLSYNINENDSLIVAEPAATYQTVITTNYDELLKKISEEFNLDLKDSVDQKKLIDALHIVIKIHGALK